jgi:hypothetical protein
MTTSGFTLRFNSKWGGRKLKRLEELHGKATVFVGIPKEAGVHPNADGMLISEIALIQEFGTARIPERPFIRMTWRENNYYRREIQEALKKALRSARWTHKTHLLVVGKKAASDMKAMILEGEFTPLAESTVRRKGHDQPLIETWAMYNAITAKVE